MTAALRKSDRRTYRETSFGPFHYLPALPWLVLAAAMRVVAAGGGPAAILAVIVATFAVLHAFLVTAQCSIEAADGQTSIGQLGFAEQLRLSFSVLWRVTLLMLAANLLLVETGFRSLGPNMMAGIDGMAFDQFTDLGKLWSAGAMIFLAFVYLGLGCGQGLARRAIWDFWQTSASGQQTKNLIYFVFIFSFAMLRLWLTLSILTYGLKQSYVRS